MKDFKIRAYKSLLKKKNYFIKSILFTMWICIYYYYILHYCAIVNTNQNTVWKNSSTRIKIIFKTVSEQLVEKSGKNQ